MTRSTIWLTIPPEICSEAEGARAHRQRGRAEMGARGRGRKVRPGRLQKARVIPKLVEILLKS